MNKFLVVIGIIVVVILVIFIVYQFDVPVMQNPAPDYHSAQGHDSDEEPNYYKKRVSIRDWIKGRKLDY